MTRRLVPPALLAVLALALVPDAGASGPSVTYAVTAGTAGSNGWYVSDVTAQIAVQGATDSTCTPVKTFRSSSDALDCTAQNYRETDQEIEKALQSIRELLS